MALPRIPTALLVALTGLAALLVFSRPHGAVAVNFTDVTNDAVQTFYYNGAPHTDWNGAPRTTYTPGTSMFPRGIFFPELCRTSHSFTWTPYTGGDTAWDGTYQVYVNVGSTANFFLAPEWVLVSSVQTAGTSIVIDKLPAGVGVHLYYVVMANPVGHFFYVPQGLRAQGPLTLSCPSGDDDDPNPVKTLHDNGFNLALIKQPNHPLPFIDQRNSQNITDFKFVIDAREGVDFVDFAESLYTEQGYGQSADIYGWQLEDEPVLRAKADTNGDGICDPSALNVAIDRLQTKYSQHNQPNQVVYSVEGAPAYFLDPNLPPGCDPVTKWDEAVNIGDAANNDYYIDLSGAPLSSVRPIADTMARQTKAVNQLKPSWFTTQAFSSGNNGCRTAPETRASVYAAIIHGATGIWYFGSDSFVIHPGIRAVIPPSYPEQPTPVFVANPTAIASCQAQWNAVAGVAGLNANLAALEPVILAPTSTLKYRISVDNPGAGNTSPVHTMLKSVAGDAQYLLAVNMDNSASTFKFEPLGMQMDTGVTGTYQYPGGNQADVRAPTYIQDTLGPFETKVYRIVYIPIDPPAMPMARCHPTGGPQLYQNCDLPPSSLDVDGDGCPRDASDVVETAPGNQPGGELTQNQSFGGRRDDFNRYDYMNPTLDGINGVDDILAVVSQYFLDDPPGIENIDYNSLTDRTAAPGGDEWDLTAPDGLQRVGDILAMVKQYFHDCRRFS